MTRASKTLAIVAALTILGVGRAAAFDAAIDNWGTLSYIEYNKLHREVNLLRGAAEVATRVTHELHKGSDSKVKVSQDLLDAYLKAFDVLQTALAMLKMGYTLVDAPQAIGEDLAKYAQLLAEYHAECLESGDIKIEDLNLVNYLESAVDPVTEDVTHIAKSVATLVTVILGNGANQIAKSNVKFAFTTKAMTDQAQAIEKDLRHVQSTVHNLLYKSTCYIKARRSFWKADLWHKKDKTDICNKAYGRWKAAGGAYKFYNQ